MRYSDELFELVQSLGKNEKRYFKMFSSRHVIGGRNTYLALFDVICKQKKYDEEKIRKKLGQTKTGKNLAIEKHRLFNLLLKSLSVYHSGMSVESRLRDQVQRVEVLFEKGLFRHGLKIIQKAKKYSIDHEKHLYLLELLRWEKRLINLDQHTPDVEGQINSVHSTEFTWAEKYKNLLSMQTLCDQLLGFQKIQGISRRPGEIAKMKKIIAELKSVRKSGTSGMYEEMLYTSAMSVYSRITLDFEKQYTYLKEQEKVYGKKPEDSTELFNYISYLNNLTLSQIRLGKYEDARNTLVRMKGFEKDPLLQKSARVKTLFLKTWIVDELFISTTLGDFEKGIEAIKGTQKEVEKNWSTIGVSYEFILSWYFAYIYFGAGNYKTALKWLNKIINHPEQNIRVDLQSFARIFSLIIHFELGNEENLPYYLKSVYKYLLKKDRMFKLETILLEFIRKKLTKINSSKDLRIAFDDLKKELMPLKEDENEREALNYFDIISWLQSKIEKRPFAEVVKEKAKKH